MQIPLCGLEIQIESKLIQDWWNYEARVKEKIQVDLNGCSFAVASLDYNITVEQLARNRTLNIYPDAQARVKKNIRNIHVKINGHVAAQTEL